MNILVLNCGSSSIKYQLFDMTDETVLAKGLVNRIGMFGSGIKHVIKGKKDPVLIQGGILDHRIGITKVLDLLVQPDMGVVKSISEIQAVGHRIAHGGEKFSQSVLIDREVLQAIHDCCTFAPLHNPANLKGVEAMTEILPDLQQVAVFDTSFHQTMKPHAFLYALPYRFYEKDGMRRYGFHGTSHRFVIRRAARILEKPLEKTRLISIHLGNGCSISAIEKGISVDTSMGHTPLEGLVMGTRCGDMDPALILHIMRKYELSVQEVDNLLNKHSGVLGISGESNDLRDLEAGWPNRNPRANLALEVYAYRIRKYIGAYIAAMNGCDALIFTAGVGENSAIVRHLTCQRLSFLGIEIDEQKNQTALRGAEVDISSPKARIRTLVVPTNEELIIAEDTMNIVAGKN